MGPSKTEQKWTVNNNRKKANYWNISNEKIIYRPAPETHTHTAAVYLL